MTQINLFTKQIESQTQKNKFMVTVGGGGGGEEAN